MKNSQYKLWFFLLAALPALFASASLIEQNEKFGFSNLFCDAEFSALMAPNILKEYPTDTQFVRSRFSTNIYPVSKKSADAIFRKLNKTNQSYSREIRFELYFIETSKMFVLKVLNIEGLAIDSFTMNECGDVI